MAKSITADQMKLIYKLGAELALDNAALHEVVWHATGCTSIRALTTVEAGRVITRLGDTLDGAKNEPLLQRDRDAMASDAQKRKLWAMMFELFRYDDLPPQTREQRAKRLAGIMRRVLKREPVNADYPLDNVTRAEIAKLIRAVGGYIEHEKRKHDADGDGSGA